MEIPTRKKGQGAFEYILLLAGILLIVVLVIVILKGGLLNDTQTNVQESANAAQINTRTQCLNWCGEGAWKGYIGTGYNASYYAVSGYCTDAVLLAGNSSFDHYNNCFWSASDENAPSNENGSTCNISATYLATGSTGTAVAIAPQNVRACSFFSGSTA